MIRRGCFQTMAVLLLGANWAYAVLGWGGLWGGTQVGTRPFCHGLTGTAFLHLGDDAGKSRA